MPKYGCLEPLKHPDSIFMSVATKEAIAEMAVRVSDNVRLHADPGHIGASVRLDLVLL